MKEPINFSCRFCEMKLRPFAFTEYSVIDAKINRNSRGSLSETNSIFCEIKKTIDIDFLISGAHKKCKTIAKAIRISSTSKDERSSVQLEHAVK
ncbi:hypothetical protein PVK06_042513 [Gossypium arboreum]|uniref:Uncharacterized protein n=1 Tax=Gossypium arboreum TaxID=29729 RepID=A0ABR0MKX7_GOSAR|nr:hypothetical protein PVK06_042513 [Gossypium arboreum]